MMSTSANRTEQPIVYAGLRRRLVASIIDGTLCAPVIWGSMALLFFGWVIIVGGIQEGGSTAPDRTPERDRIGGAVALAGVALATTPLIYLTVGWRQGRTLGAWIAGVRVVGLDRRRLLWRQALARVATLGLPLLLSYLLGYLLSLAGGSSASFVTTTLPVLVLAALLLLDGLSMLRDPRCQTLHDRLAGSIVVRTKAGTDGQ